MHKYSEVIGLPVLCANNGKSIGVVEDMVFSPEKRRVCGFMLERKGYEAERKVILLKDVQNLGHDAVIVDSPSCPMSLKRAENEETFRDRGKVLGLRVYSKTGEDLGFTKDILFDWHTGVIEGVEISDGLFLDIVQGRRVLPLFGKVEFGEEYLLVSKEAVEEMMPTGGGIKKRFLGEGRK